MPSFKASVKMVIIASLTIMVACSCHAPDKSKPNIILIVLDTLRADHLGCYGYRKNTSPYIDLLAKNGVTFKNHFSTSSITMTATASIMTGLLPYKHRAYYPHPLDSNVTTITEVLRNNGYTTAGFIANPQVRSELGFNQGFDLYHEKELKEYNGKDTLDLLDIDKKLTNGIIAWLQKERKSPFFVYIHFMGSHHPYLTIDDKFKTLFINEKDYSDKIDFKKIMEKPYQISLFSKIPNLIETLKALYDNKISQADSYVGLIYGFLRNNGLIDDTLIIITSDHGEEFYEHESFTHGCSVYNEVISVPLIMSFPKKLRTDYQAPHLTQSIDIFPTIVDLLDIKITQEIDGMSFHPLIAKGDLSLFAIVNDLNKLTYGRCHSERSEESRRFLPSVEMTT